MQSQYSTTLPAEVQETDGAALYLQAMLEQDTHDPGSVDWIGVHDVLDELHADACYVDEVQTNQAWEVWR